MIAENAKNIKENISTICEKAGRSAGEITLVAVSKTFGPEKITEVLEAGIFDIGENYVQELAAKREKLIEKPIRWHFVGHLQSNKVKQIVGWIHLIHSVDNESLAAELQKRAHQVSRIVDVLVEVNTSGEVSKFGVKPHGALEFIRVINKFPNLRVTGLMTMGPFLPDPEQSRPAFRALRTILEEVNAASFLQEPLKHLSMGMSHDFQVAIEEGATIVRIGTAIFGQRETTT